MGMVRTIVGCMAIAVLTLGVQPASAAEPTVAEQVARLKPGQKIRVELTSGETLKGRMGSATADQFALEPRSPGVNRTIRFVAARSVKRDGMSTGEKWAIFGVAWIALSIVGYSINH